MVLLELPNWEAFKSTCITTENLNCQYVQSADRYDIYGSASGVLTWHTTIMTGVNGADQTDFETNYKTIFNSSLSQFDVTGRLRVTDTSAGPVSPGIVATTSELMGGQFNTTPSTLTDKQQIALQTNSSGALYVSERSLYNHVVGNVTVLVKARAGTLAGIVVNNPSGGGTCEIWDSLTADNGALIGTLYTGTSSANTTPASIDYFGLEFTIGLTIRTKGTLLNDFTILYR